MWTKTKINKDACYSYDGYSYDFFERMEEQAKKQAKEVVKVKPPVQPPSQAPDVIHDITLEQCMWLQQNIERLLEEEKEKQKNGD